MGGCFSSRDLSNLREVHLQPLRINFKTYSSSDSLDKPGLVITVASRPETPRTLEGKYDLFRDRALNEWGMDIESGAVNFRAWVIQEVSLQSIYNMLIVID
jgi:hypothetical protein